MTLEEALAWCMEHEVDLCFYKNKDGDKRIRIDLGSSTLVERHTSIIEAVLSAKREINRLDVKSRWI